MTDKIIVEFSRKELEKECENCAYDKAAKKLKSKEPALSICSRTDNDIVLCNLRHILDFKIKEQKNQKNKEIKEDCSKHFPVSDEEFYGNHLATRKNSDYWG